MSRKYKPNKKNIPVDNPMYDEEDVEMKTDDQTSRLDLLLEQAEAISKFVENVSLSSEANKKGKSKASLTMKDVNDSKIKAKNGTAAGTADIVQYDKTPNFINGEMRDYQLRGLNWLISLYENNVSGILGDEMGLGKTIQTISILGYLKECKKINGPFLVVAPLSTIRNWWNEVTRFCPTLRAFVLHGERPVRPGLLRQLKHQQETWDLCITTYEMCTIELHSLVRPAWKYVVLDEGHKIKNDKTQVSKATRSIKCRHRLILTGTPLQNNLHELWALLNFVMPDVFASAKDFDAWFDADKCLSGDDRAVKRLHSILGAFMLRRIKSDVETSLLPKRELKLYVKMTELQRDTYIKVLLKKVETINSLGEASWKTIRMVAMELRKVANHPYLISCVEPGPPYTNDQHLFKSCGKMTVLDQLLTVLQAQNSRVVLFSQFTIMLNIIEDYLVWKGYKFLRLDGSRKLEQRASDIEQFNAPGSDIFIFMISTRAGSLGINLATAETVIMYDSDWNPQVDFQAIDRVHRIGQTKQVNVYRLVTENSIDHRMVQRAEIKQRLENMVVQNSRNGGTAQAAPQAMAEPGRKEMIDMIRFDAEKVLGMTGDVDFDLTKIMQESMEKVKEEKDKYARMTLAEASSESVYNFESTDFRQMQA